MSKSVNENNAADGSVESSDLLAAITELQNTWKREADRNRNTEWWDEEWTRVEDAYERAMKAAANVEVMREGASEK